jgi:heat-inducible transcriptional repressor
VERPASRVRPSRQFEQSVLGAIQPQAADPDAWARSAAEVLSNALHNVAVATSSKVWQARVKQLQLVHLQDRQALLVLVLQDAHVRQHMVQTSQTLTQEELTSLSNRLNSLLAGHTADEIRTTWDSGVVSGPAADSVIGELLGLLDLEDQDRPGRQYTEGLRHMLSQPEFESGRRAREAVEVIEDGLALRHVIVDAERDRNIDVVIGEENRHEPLKAYSVVFARYGRPGHVLGVIGTVGPTRMDYARAIANVRYLADFLSDLVIALEDNG